MLVYVGGGVCYSLANMLIRSRMLFGTERVVVERKSTGVYYYNNNATIIQCTFTFSTFGESERLEK